MHRDFKAQHWDLFATSVTCIAAVLRSMRERTVSLASDPSVSCRVQLLWKQSVGLSLVDTRVNSNRCRKLA